MGGAFTWLVCPYFHASEEMSSRKMANATFLMKEEKSILCFYMA